MEQEYIKNFLTDVAQNKMFERLLACVRGGTNKFFLRSVQETLQLDETWINRIDTVLYNIELIIRNPRKFIKEEEIVVDVERAKKTGTRTVRHLAANTRNIRNVKTGGEVVPQRVLTTTLEEDICIYENRFVGALVHKIYSFVVKRREAIADHKDLFTNTVLDCDSKFKYGDDTLSCKIELNAKEPPNDPEHQKKIDKMIDKIDEILKRIQVIETTSFMKQIDKSKTVRAPIQKTNLIRLQTDYRECYNLWLYISSYTALGYSIEVKEKTLPIEGDYFDDISVITSLSLNAMLHNNSLNKEKYEAVAYEEPTRKDFKNMTKIEFESDFKFEKDKGGDDVVNEFYYQQMQKAFKKDAKRPEGDSPALQERQMAMSFAHYYRSVSQINDCMFRDLIAKQAPKPKSKSVLDMKIASAQEQEMYIKRIKQLQKLREEDVEKAKRDEKKEELKLKKMKIEIVNERKRIEKERLEKERQRMLEEKRLAEEKAAKEAALAKEKAEKEAARLAAEQEAARKRDIARIEKERQEALKRESVEARERKKILEKKAEELVRLQKIKEAERELKRLQAQQAAALAQLEKERAKLLGKLGGAKGDESSAPSELAKSASVATIKRVATAKNETGKIEQLKTVRATQKKKSDEGGEQMSLIDELHQSLMDEYDYE